MAIADFLPEKDLASMMLASRAAYGATRSQSFWKRRLQQDAPWYWEAFSTSSPSVINSYEKEYQKVMMQARRPVELAKRNQHVSDLANRRRIWEVSQQVLEMYAKICPLHPNTTAKSSSELKKRLVLTISLESLIRRRAGMMPVYNSSFRQPLTCPWKSLCFSSGGRRH